MPAANVGNVERIVTLAAGAALLGYAWRHRSRGLGWRTLRGETIQHAGSVVFKSLPGSGGTEVRVHLH